ncbi:MAG: AbrB/MazE/SpoVT family DNA-binding domain-containing protein [Proteobacteria bacterium]|nr:AbrB/MazE/SpoVT family DNA-binding domain-containing protein [Pseudomonadota bacterium]
MKKTRLNSKGQLVVPKAIRDHMSVAAGTEFVVLEAVRSNRFPMVAPRATTNSPYWFNRTGIGGQAHDR